jgi:arylsulfatase A-like enzyme
MAETPRETPPLEALSPALQAGLAIGTGFALAALVNALFIVIRLPLPAGGPWLRFLHHVFDASGVLGVGLVAALVIGAGTALVERGAASSRGRRIRRALGLLVYAAAATAIMLELIDYELHRFSLSLFRGRFASYLFPLGVAIAGLAVPAAHVAGILMSRGPKLRLVSLAVALGFLVANHLVLRDDYAGLHGAITWLGATLGGLSLAPLVETLSRKMRPRARRVPLVFAACAGLFGLAVPPSVSVRLELFREPGAISAWFLARTWWRLPGEADAKPPPEIATSPYFQPREKLAPVPPTNPPLLANGAPVVVLITIDAVRADAIDTEKNQHYFPTIARLTREGAYFTRASSPGSQTAVSLSSLFTGRYFSQLVWADHGEGSTRFSYPAKDPSPRFPEILAQRGIPTASFCSITFLGDEYGVARGFDEQHIVTKGREHAHADKVMEPLLERLRRADAGPLFLYAHLIEPHSPYDRGGKKGPTPQRYLAEIGVVDEYIEKLVQLLDERFPGRAYLFLTSDHGEAFGEHGTFKHTKTLYDELLRIPLLVHGPGIAARRIDERAGLVDLGPTILDLFGVETPPSFMGQSLVPLLAGRDVRLDRPLLAEGRLRRVLYWGDLKVIDDPRRKVVEAFDLAADPKEHHNLFDMDRARVSPALAALRAFFAVHQTRVPGYEPPYKP